MISKSLFGSRLKEQRKKLGLTQAEAAQRAGIERETWGKYERGIFMPSGDVLISFLGMGINVGVLFSTDETEPLPNNTLTAEEQQLLNCYRRSTGKDREMIMFIANKVDRFPENQSNNVRIGKIGQVINTQSVQTINNNMKD